jgi:hypothetical protein
LFASPASFGAPAFCLRWQGQIIHPSRRTGRPCSKPVGEAPVPAVPLNRRTESAAPNKLAARGWKQKTPTIVPPWREDGAGPIFPRFPRIVARSSWVAFAQLSTQ